MRAAEPSRGVAVTPAWKEALVKGAGELAHPLDGAKVDALALFCDRLLEWNAKIDLSSITDPDEIREKHVLDSLSGFALLRPTDLRIADLGSGGGFPGVVLAIVDPARRVLSVESRGKKAVFQRQVARELGLTNLEVRAERIEALQMDPPEVITARALADLDELVRLTERWLTGGASHLLAWKSSKVDEEIGAAGPRLAKTGVRVLERKDLKLPGSGEPRTLLRLGV